MTRGLPIGTVGACVDGTSGYMPRTAPARSSTPSSSVSRRNPQRRPLARLPVGERQVERFDGHLQRLREGAGAALEQQRIADREHPLGRGQRQVVATGAPPAAQAQVLGAQLVQPQPPERDEQVIAAHATEAREREAFEDALEAPLGRPGGVAAEGVRLGGPGPLAVGAQRGRPRVGVVGAARPELQARRGPAARRGRPSAASARSIDSNGSPSCSGDR